METTSQDDLDDGDGKLSKDQRIALMLVTRYYLGHVYDGESKGKKKPLAEKELFPKLYSRKWRQAVDEDERAASHAFNNFLRSGAPKAAEYFYEYFKPLRGRFSKAPDFVQHMYGIFYGEMTEQSSGDASMKSIIGKITEDAINKDGTIEKIATSYAGRFDVLRYSAHLRQPDKKRPPDPRIMRAALEIFAPVRDNNLPTFEIRYRPHSLDDKDGYFGSQGTVYPLGTGEHLLFLGWEDPSKYPLVIVAKLERQPAGRKKAGLFQGLVIRRHEFGHIFASRVLFVRSPAPSLDAMSRRKKIGMFYRSDILARLAKESPRVPFSSLLNRIVNVVGAGGFSGLWLDRDP